MREFSAFGRVGGREPVDAVSINAHDAEARAAAPTLHGCPKRRFIARLHHAAPCRVARIPKPYFRKQLLANNRVNAVRSYEKLRAVSRAAHEAGRHALLRLFKAHAPFAQVNRVRRKSIEQDSVKLCAMKGHGRLAKALLKLARLRAREHAAL